MKLVLLESPYAGDVELNVFYARLCMRDCLLKGEAPYASHLLYTQPNVLDDNIAKERGLGINAGLEWGRHAKKTVVYVDLGISKGMKYGIANAEKFGRSVKYRTLPNWKGESIKISIEKTFSVMLKQLGHDIKKPLDKLDFDELDVLDFSCEVEEVFDVEIPDKNFTTFVTIQDVSDFVTREFILKQEEPSCL